MTNNPANIRVSYDEDKSRKDSNTVESEVSSNVSEIEGVNSVTVDTVHFSRPYEVDITVEYDGDVIDFANLKQQISYFSFVHNAQ